MSGTLGATLLAQGGGNEGGFGFGSIVAILIELAILVAIVAGMWKMFEKAGKPGWASVIPIYNTLVLLQIVGRPWWWLLVLCIPCVNFIAAVLICLDLARCFGKDTLYAIGILLLGFIFVPILGFGDARYIGPQQH